MREIPITHVEEGQKLLRFLGKCLPGASGGFLHKMLRKKNIKLNGKKADGSETLRSGDHVQIYFSEETFLTFSTGGLSGFHENRKTPHRNRISPGIRPGREMQALRSQVQVLYRNADMIILHKPAGMLSQKSSPEDDSLNDYLLDLCREEGWIGESSLEHFRPSVANRLDRNTSGLVLCGITTKGLQFLSGVLKERSLSKIYLALVAGQVEDSRKTKGYLSKDEKKNVVTFTTDPRDGAASVETEYEVLCSCREASLLKIRLITGKSHQIRAHLAAEGYPVLGDYKYGDRNVNQNLKRTCGISCQLLHSYEVDFGESYGGLVVRDEIPREFLRVMKYYGMANPL